MLLWSAALLLHSASGLWGVFFLFRFLLGAFECVVSPILIAMVASWYKKNEQSKRIGMFYISNGITQCAIFP
jgi:ACS family allantoate permease-like MFS transporter